MFVANKSHVTLLKRGLDDRMVNGVVHVDSEVTVVEQDIRHVIHQVFNAGDSDAVHSGNVIGNKIARLQIILTEKALPYANGKSVPTDPTKYHTHYLVCSP